MKPRWGGTGVPRKDDLWFVWGILIVPAAMVIEVAFRRIDPDQGSKVYFKMSGYRPAQDRDDFDLLLPEARSVGSGGQLP
jgi:RecB family exonuclease